MSAPLLGLLRIFATFDMYWKSFQEMEDLIKRFNILGLEKFVEAKDFMFKIRVFYPISWLATDDLCQKKLLHDVNQV